jgi:hypothetical protein
MVGMGRIRPRMGYCGSHETVPTRARRGRLMWMGRVAHAFTHPAKLHAIRLWAGRCEVPGLIAALLRGEPPSGPR